jgi:hypothetical protein
VAATLVPLPRLETQGEGSGRLWGLHVRVRNGGAVNQPDPVTGGVRAVPIGDARPNAAGDFVFDPGWGGGRLDKVVLAEPAHRQHYIAASHFGEVNAFFHLGRIAAHVADLLHELGAPPLPRVTAVVNAHHSATETDGRRDGVWRGVLRPRWLTFQGGHYRLPARRYDVPEHAPIDTAGEIHLGPGRHLLTHGALVEAAGRRYRHNASHNAGILYHEYGHHLTRHTADFRANAYRRPDRQKNRKTDLDEGFCDYWAATMLGTPHIWAWHRRHDAQEVHPRSLVSAKTMADYDPSPGADEHDNGTIWAAALWDLRTQLQADGPEGVRRADLLVLQTLLLIGRTEGAAGEATPAAIAHARAGFPAALAALLRADELLYAGQHRRTIRAVFGRRGLQPERRPVFSGGSQSRASAKAPPCELPVNEYEGSP